MRLHPTALLLRRTAAMGLLLGLVLPLSGCNVIAWAAAASRKDKPVDIPAEYLDMVDKRIAVMVAADEYTMFRFPRATDRVGLSVSNAIHGNVDEAVVSIPAEIARYQRKNPYWITARPSRLIDELGVDRLVIIDLNEYRTHEGRNTGVWQGVIDGTVTVHEADGEDPDNAAFQKQVRAEFPEDSNFGMISADTEAESIEAATLRVFARRAGGLFFDYQEVRP
ncbi:MAG: hypothetical protein AAGH99_12400 [Planctomycetota bacterium]